MTTVAIHQPNFLPWLGYFAKISSCDVFIIYDDCPLSKPSWTNRVKILERSGPQWLTVPVIARQHTQIPLYAVPVNDMTPWRKKAERTLTQAYRKTPFFDEAAELFFPVLRDRALDHLTTLNEVMIQRVSEMLGISARFIRASCLPASNARATERLVELVQAVQGTQYLSGDGAESYIDTNLFNDFGIDLRYLGFISPHYPQIGRTTHVPGLSIFDAIANVGVSRTRMLLSIDEGMT
jgi:hypothetical protein